MVVELFVERLVAGGDGLAVMDGMKVFVPRAAPQERVRARITVRKRDYAVAAIEELLEPSPLRVVPRCPLFGSCGGCQFQHISYDGQLVVKKLMVNDSLQHVGRVFVPVANVLARSECWRYRNKTQYPVGGTGEVRVGFYRQGSHRVIDVPECLLHPREFDLVRASAARAIARHDRAYDERRHDGNVRHLILRRADGAGDVLAILVTRTGSAAPELADALAAEPAVVGVVHSLNAEPTSRILGRRLTVLRGRDHLVQTVMGRRFRVSAASFFQVNTAQAGELCRKVLQLAALTGTERVVDLYSGVGMLSIVLAQAAGVVTGVELDPGAVEDARTNAEMAGCSNVTFVAGDVEEVLHGVPAADVVVVDPPRKGCSPAVLKRIVELAPARVIYVSCNPATLARDLSLLEQAGYATTEVEPIDMFPQTFHIETIARLVKSA